MVEGWISLLEESPPMQEGNRGKLQEDASGTGLGGTT